ncbi:MAG TPA: polysaccharide deacetylase family protein [Candidatus Acutalibacter pullistercoris]|uniref:Polysaccharide deacetylase family protein n=1 Tax=Candidatus Acutalibacter pullistercoris TaxID=2838418 RepID=A0A9D2BZL0_9FIRM|nr:polysaccharide deacetylase family protein [Candidatus Acutalibacter pullistercoris]
MGTKKRLAALIGAAAVGALCLAGVWASREGEALLASAQPVNWGLSFPQEGEPPQGTASRQELDPLGAAYCLPETGKTLYLTFDAGYENGNTAQILDALKKHGAKATFFLVGDFIQAEPELVRRMAEEGHILGNHTCSHPDMSQIAGEEEFRRELEDNEALCREAAGVELSKLYRPPQGKYSRRNLEMAQALGYRTVFWSLAYVDWLQDDQPTKTEAFQKLLPRVHPGAIVLLHTTSSTNAAILDELLTQWEQLGYQFGDLEQALSCGENLEDNSQLELWHSPAPVQ